MAKKLTQEEKLKKQLAEAEAKLKKELAKKKEKVVVPPVISTKKKTGKTKPKSTRSTVVHKSSKPSENLYQVLSATEGTIQEITRLLSETGDSRHKGVRGLPKLTLKQQILQKQLDHANKRYNEILRLIDRLK